MTEVSKYSFCDAENKLWIGAVTYMHIMLLICNLYNNILWLRNVTTNEANIQNYFHWAERHSGTSDSAVATYLVFGSNK